MTMRGSQLWLQKLQSEDLRQARADIDELKRIVGLKIGRPPKGWLTLRQVAARCNVTPEAARLWCLQNAVTADRFQGRWFVDPTSLEHV